MSEPEETPLHVKWMIRIAIVAVVIVVPITLFRELNAMNETALLVYLALVIATGIGFGLSKGDDNSKKDDPSAVNAGYDPLQNDKLNEESVELDAEVEQSALPDGSRAQVNERIKRASSNARRVREGKQPLIDSEWEMIKGTYSKEEWEYSLECNLSVYDNDEATANFVWDSSLMSFIEWEQGEIPLERMSQQQIKHAEVKVQLAALEAIERMSPAERELYDLQVQIEYLASEETVVDQMSPEEQKTVELQRLIAELRTPAKLK